VSLIHACGGAGHGFFSGWKNFVLVSRKGQKRTVYQGLQKNANEILHGDYREFGLQKETEDNDHALKADKHRRSTAMKELAGAWLAGAELVDDRAGVRLAKDAFERFMGWVATVMAWSFRFRIGSRCSVMGKR
jgi:hypothetical protein